MAITGFDHVAITVADQERTIAFYRDLLGAEILYEKAWREGRIPIVGLRLGVNVINVHLAAAPGSPRAEHPTPGSADLCFRWSGPVAAAARLLEENGIAVELGPVDRWASDGNTGKSVYFRDPDGNLLELLTIDQ